MKVKSRIQNFWASAMIGRYARRKGRVELHDLSFWAVCVAQPYITAVSSGSGSKSSTSDSSEERTEFLENMMRLIVVTALFVAAVASPTAKVVKREAYALPEGAELLVGPIHTTFKCIGNGYYADVDNNCQIFHVCFSQVTTDGTRSDQQYSFICGNQTVFNQLTFTCTYPEDAVPCIHAQDFYYLNTRIEAADPDVHFLDDLDIQRAAPLLEGDHYTRRVEKPQNVPYRTVPSRRRLPFDDYAAKK